MKEELIKLKNEIVFVTSNKGKVASAQERLDDIKLEIFNYDLIEPRSDDVKVIAESKVRQAYEVVKKPCIALDAGFYINALNGFPRAFVNFALDTIGVDGILKLMEGKENRKCRFTECLSYYDGNELHQFMGKHEGNLSNEKLGNDTDKKWSDLWYIFKPYGYEKTLAEMTDEERKNRTKYESVDAMREFAKWYKES